jgi:hypothetical protein
MTEYDFLRLFRLSHVIVGVLGIGIFWIPVFAAKGGLLHTRCGRLFAWCACYGGATGLFLSCWALVHPPSFFGNPALQHIREADLPYQVENARFLYSITGFVALMVVAGTWFGVRLARTRSDHARLRSPPLLALLGMLALWSVWLIVYGAYSLIASHAGTHLLPSSAAGRYWVSIVLGIIGVYAVVGDLRYILRLPATRWAWRYRHMECMLGAGVGFHGAAFFFIAKELLHVRLEGAAQLAPALLPVALGVPAMWMWIAREERRLEAADEGERQ